MGQEVTDYLLMAYRMSPLVRAFSRLLHEEQKRGLARRADELREGRIKSLAGRRRAGRNVRGSSTDRGHADGGRPGCCNIRI